MTHRITVDTEVDAECPVCSQDLVCPECDSDEIKESFDLPQIPTEHTTKLIDGLRSLYGSALDEGRYHDKDLLHGLIEWLT